MQINENLKSVVCEINQIGLMVVTFHQQKQHSLSTLDLESEVDDSMLFVKKEMIEYNGSLQRCGLKGLHFYMCSHA